MKKSCIDFRSATKNVWILLIALLVFPLGAFALDIRPFAGFQDARAQASGGPYVAVTDGFSAMFANPASLIDPTPVFSAGRIGLGVDGPVFDIANLALASSGGSTDILGMVKDLLAANSYKMYVGVDLSGPFSIGYKGDGLGFGVFTQTHAVIDVGSISSIKVGLAEDILVTGGYAFRLNLGKRNTLDFGLLAKGFMRGSLDLNGGLIDLLSLVSDPSSLMSHEFTLTSGVGLDLGARWSWAEILAFGVTWRDAFSPALVSTFSNITDFASSAQPSKEPEKGLVKSNLEVGLMIRPPLGVIGRVVDDLRIMIDYERLLDFLDPVYRNPILNAKLGLELRVLEILTLRTGFAEGLLHAGAEFNLGFVRVNATAWGQELGYEPGQRSVYNLLLGLDFVY